MAEKKYALLIDLDRCTGCHACQVTCKTEYSIPFGTFRCRVETYKSGIYPTPNKLFLPRLCNHCANAPCIDACEEDALYRNSDGVVLLNQSSCTGCQLCHDECPYDAIQTSSYTGQVEKCDFCYERRVSRGLDPVCVQSCMGKAMHFGDRNDRNSLFFQKLQKKNLLIVEPGFRTSPSVFYLLKRKPPSGTPLGDTHLKFEPPAEMSEPVLPETPSGSHSQTFYTSDAMCPSECGLVVHVKDGVAEKIYGNPHTLVNNGTLCAKGAAGLQLTYSPHRVRTPLMRMGERGEDRWRQITWEEAAGHVARTLVDIKKKYGPESVFLDCGDMTDREAYYRLFHAFGTPNTYNHGSICDPNRKWGQRIMMGDERPLPDIQRPFVIRDGQHQIIRKKAHDARLVLNIGANPFVATRFNYMSYGIPSAREEGCLYIVVDPAHTNSAAHADKWLPIRPGTDAALLSAMLHYLITNDSGRETREKYLDHEFIEKYTVGWESFKEAFLNYSRKRDSSNNLHNFTPAWAAEKTGLPEREIRELSHLFGSTRPASMEIGMHGTAHHTNGDVTSILMATLCLITGNVDRPGGLVFTDSQKPKKGELTTGRQFLDRVASREIDGKSVSGRLSELHKDMYGDFPAAWKGVLADLPRKMREGVSLRHGPFRNYTYPVKAFITRAGNPVVSAGNTHDWISGITRRDRSGQYELELMVCIDTHITVTGRFADLILPEAGYLERMGLSDVYTMSPELAIRDQVIPPLYESKTPYEIMMTLSRALVDNDDPHIRPENFTKYNSEEDFINEILMDTPGFYNVGQPLPYPELPEGSLIMGTPDNPSAIMSGNVVREGERLTVDWLRKHHGVAIWPASYFRYRKKDGTPTSVYPRTPSGKFEFTFGYLEDINNMHGTNLPTTFYWKDCNWNPKNPAYRVTAADYPFQLISGRTHHAMTITGPCTHLAETLTECMIPLNKEFTYKMPALDNIPNTLGFRENVENHVPSGKVSLPVFAFNIDDGKRLSLKTGNTVVLENPGGQQIRGRVFLTEEIMPGVIKTAFGPGGQRASGLGFMNHVVDSTPNVNDLVDGENLTVLTGMPGFGDIMVRVLKD